MGTVVTGTSALALHTGSIVADVLAVAFYVGLIGAWATVALRTVQGSARGHLFLSPAPA